MANASKKNLGPSTQGQGKGDGTGALTELPDGVLEENMVLSNRDKSRHSEERGLDGRMVQTEQYHDHSANRRSTAAQDEKTQGANVSGMSAPKTTTSGADSSSERRGD